MKEDRHNGHILCDFIYLNDLNRQFQTQKVNKCRWRDREIKSEHKWTGVSSGDDENVLKLKSGEACPTS